MLGLLPFLALACIAGGLYLRFPSWGWKKSILRGSIAWGVYLVLLTELLSLAHWLTWPTLVVMWAVPVVGFVAFFSSAPTLRRRPPALSVRWPRSTFILACISVIAAVAFLTAVVAWVAPPTTYDSLTYHMSRVAHWAQDRSLEPFATGIFRQAYMSPGAELLVLQLYILARGDRLANFAEWAAMIICIVAAAKIAADLGSSERGQWIAGVFVATLPMGIAQASSTMTDYVTAWWVVCAAAEVSELLSSTARIDNFAYMALAAGLALLAKPTGAVFLAPFALLAFWKLVRSFRAEQALVIAGLATAAVVILNAGYLSRNLITFGRPFGPAVQAFANEIFSWRVVLSNTLRNASLHAGTSWDWLNEQLYVGLAKVHVKLGLGLHDPRTSWHGFFAVRPFVPSENSVGNTWQAVAAIVAAGLTLFGRRRSKAQLEYLALVSASFVLFSAVFKFDMLGSRYHMPFFVLLAPIVGVSFGTLRGWVQWSAVGLFAASAYAPFVSLRQRPLLPQEDKPSILFQTREQLLLRESGLGSTYSEFVDEIGEAGCREVGLALRGNAPEYPIWDLMGAPRSDVVFDWIIARGDSTAKFRRAGFAPCAIICQGCARTREPFNDLPWVAERRGYQLYLRETQLP